LPYFLWQGLTYFDQAAILDPISHLLPVKVDPLPLPISSPHGITLFKQGSIPSDNVAIKPTGAQPAPNVELDPTLMSTSVNFSTTEDINQFQESGRNLVLHPEEPKLDHF
jgi:hypothetical protein